MKWDQFKNSIISEPVFVNKVKTDIECPKCGRKLYYRSDIVLTSYPAQYQYECECGFVGYAHMKWGDK